LEVVDPGKRRLEPGHVGEGGDVAVDLAPRSREEVGARAGAEPVIERRVLELVAIAGELPAVPLLEGFELRDRPPGPFDGRLGPLLLGADEGRLVSLTPGLELLDRRVDPGVAPLRGRRLLGLRRLLVRRSRHRSLLPLAFGE